MRLPRKQLVLSVGVAVALLGLSAGCSSLDQWQRRAIFQHEHALNVDNRFVPGEVTEFDLEVPGGGVTGKDKVHAWYMAAAKPNAPTLLYLHGARHNLYGNASRIERLQELGFNVLALDYRGFGQSTRILPSEETAIEDVKLAFAELQRREPDAGKRFVYGYSLGGALAIALAHDVDGMAGVIIESSFTSIPDVVRTMRWGWLPFLNLAVTQEFNSEARIGRVNEPLLFLHGTADGIVPHTMSDRLFAAARSVPAEYKRVIKIDGASHRGALAMAVAEYGDTLSQFVLKARARTALFAGGASSPVVTTGAAQATTVGLR